MEDFNVDGARRLSGCKVRNEFDNGNDDFRYRVEEVVSNFLFGRGSQVLGVGSWSFRRKAGRGNPARVGQHFLLKELKVECGNGTEL